MKIVLKGVQTAADAVKAAEQVDEATGRQLVAGVVISNHGGRQLDFSRPPIEVLADVVPALEQAGHAGKLELLVDGGIRRGTDVFKALALGASAVGIGKPVAYAMSAYGQPGIEAMADCLHGELIRIASQSEVIRAIVSDHSPCCRGRAALTSSDWTVRMPPAVPV